MGKDYLDKLLKAGTIKIQRMEKWECYRDGKFTVDEVPRYSIDATCVLFDNEIETLTHDKLIKLIVGRCSYDIDYQLNSLEDDNA